MVAEAVLEKEYVILLAPIKALALILVQKGQASQPSIWPSFLME
jgi:hypothetical protein